MPPETARAVHAALMVVVFLNLLAWGWFGFRYRIVRNRLERDARKHGVAPSHALYWEVLLRRGGQELPSAAAFRRVATMVLATFVTGLICLVAARKVAALYGSGGPPKVVVERSGVVSYWDRLDCVGRSDARNGPGSVQGSTATVPVGQFQSQRISRGWGHVCYLIEVDGQPQWVRTGEVTLLDAP